MSLVVWLANIALPVFEIDTHAFPKRGFSIESAKLEYDVRPWAGADCNVGYPDCPVDYGIERVRKSLRERLSPKERRGLMHDRFLLLKRERDLDAHSRVLLDSWMTLHPELAVAYRLQEGFYGIYDASSRAEAQRRYGKWAAEITPGTREAFRPLTTAWKNWHPEILNYFDHRVTNAYTESLNKLIRVVNRMGHGYSFEALRAKMLFTEGLHKVERPKFERREANGVSALLFRLPGEAVGMMTPDDVYQEPANYGTDISTLGRRIEAGHF